MRLAVSVLLSAAACGLDAQAPAVFNIASCGAQGDNTTLNTLAIQKCFDLAIGHVAAGGGSATVFVPEGVFVTGAVVLSGTNITLSFAEGGYFQGSPNASDYGLDWGEYASMHSTVQHFLPTPLLHTSFRLVARSDHRQRICRNRLCRHPGLWVRNRR